MPELSGVRRFFKACLLLPRRVYFSGKGEESAHEQHLTKKNEDGAEMKMQTSLTRTRCYALVVCIFAALGVSAADTNQGSVVALDTVNQYLAVREKNTSLQNQRAEKEILGKVVEGTIKVWDVTESGDTVVIEANSSGAKLRFAVTDPQLKETAAALKKNGTVQIRATSVSFWRQDSKYINVQGTFIAEFKDVQSLVEQKVPEKK